MRLTLAMAFFWVACAGLAAPASAFEIFGVRLFGSEKEPPPPDAISYSVEVTVPEGDNSLKKEIQNASRLYEGRKEVSPGPAALLATARGDYQRILATLYADGRYGGTISIRVAGLEAADAPIDSDIPDGATVLINVDPGPVYLFENLKIENRPGPIANDRTLPKTPEELGFVDGLPAKSTVVLAAESSLVGRWREKGYPKARIAERTATAVAPERELDVYIRTDPGRPAVFGGTTVNGTSRMDPGFVAYYAGITPGEPFDPDVLDRARDQLRRLETFNAVRIVEADEVTNEGTLPITLEVAERKRFVVGGGALFSSVDGFGLEGYWRDRNLFGRGEKLSVEASAGGIDGDDPNGYNYSLALSFLKPGVFTPYTDFASRVYAEQLAPTTFRARTVGANAGFKHRFDERLSGEIFAKFEASTIDETTVGDGDFYMLSLPGALNYDGSDNALDPTRGFRVGLKAEPFQEFNYNNTGLISEVAGSVYFPLADERVVLAARAMVGSIVGVPLDEMPANRLYFAGGGGSIRGYPYLGVGPRDAFGEIVGGRSIFTTSAEARIKVTPSIGIVPFVDAGNAFESELPDFDQPLKVGAGVGLRYYTGLGPIRFDVAVPLEPYDGDPPIAFYIGLGQAF